MIHSPRRLSPNLQNENQISLHNPSPRDILTHRPITRNQRPKTRDESHGENNFSRSEDALPRLESKRSQTTSPNRQNGSRKTVSESTEVNEKGAKKDDERPSRRPIRPLEVRIAKMSPTSPSSSSTLSFTTSCSTVDSHSLIPTDSEQGYSPNQEALPALQLKNNDYIKNDNIYEHQFIDEDSFDLVVPPDTLSGNSTGYSLEDRAELLFSHEHLQTIFDDPSLLLKFTSFLSLCRASSIPILVYYLDSIKALKAISYSNAIAEALEPLPGIEFTNEPIPKTINPDLEERSRKAFDIIVREDLPAYVTYVYTQTVSLTIQRRITGTLPPHLVEASEGLAEVFCMTDPSRPDNPIIFSSEEFHRTTQYGTTHAIGQNCRFLQGPKTNPFTIKRFREKIDAGVEHCEVILNYRRDGSPFMNLLMCAPLCDSKGKIRYFIGAQVDVSGLVKECSELESFKRLVTKLEEKDAEADAESEHTKDEFQELSEMLNLQELDTVRRWGGRMHKDCHESSTENTRNWSKPHILINPNSPDCTQDFNAPYPRWGGKLSGIYKNYLLVRPYPSMFILFASPSLRVPGILQSPLMSKIGGSERVREELVRAFADGHGVTAKVKWVSKSNPEGRNRWIHCTPLIGTNGAIGVWMVIIVDDENSHPKRSQKMAPPVDPKVGRTNLTSEYERKDYGTGASRSAMSVREGSLRSVPDSPFSTVTFDLRSE
ncbi:putative white collar protein [Golovinomyces cichoracearum]|uniref:Putative white collar protein n=1 Tax=Golovinomyces cichoracearum TaxID=62708 RepID=A0A420IUW9_9PEZI|nr:putative white collar protein [Golovinomyces cichoracearum]